MQASPAANQPPAEISEDSLSDADKAAVVAFSERRKIRPRLAKSKVQMRGATNVVAWEHETPTLAEIHLANTLNTDDFAFSEGLRQQIAGMSASSDGEVSPGKLDHSLSIVRAIEPRDPVEALLAAQMASIHNATMSLSQVLATAETLPQHEVAGNLLNKLARTFTQQVEALKKHRSTGEQTIRVQHVTVNDGGQAIVGNVRKG